MGISWSYGWQVGGGRGPGSSYRCMMVFQKIKRDRALEWWFASLSSAKVFLCNISCLNVNKFPQTNSGAHKLLLAAVLVEGAGRVHETLFMAMGRVKAVCCGFSECWGVPSAKEFSKFQMKILFCWSNLTIVARIKSWRQKSEGMREWTKRTKKNSQSINQL